MTTTTKNRRHAIPDRAGQRILTATLSAFLVAACGAHAGGGGDEDDFRPDAAPSQDPDASPPDPMDPDASLPEEEEPQRRIVVNPVTFEIRIGESVEIEATIETDGEDDVEPGASLSFESSNPSVAEIIGEEEGVAVVRGRSEGTVTILASSGDLEGISAGSVLALNYGACCQPDIDNFCHVSPGTDGCPMTQPGGYCDPDGNSSYDDADWAYGYNHFADVCGPYLDEEPPEQDQCSQPLPMADNADEPCEPSELETWRCATSPVWGGIQVSQVCRDYGSGPKYYTFNLNPVACCDCSGGFSQSCCAANSPSNGCEGVGDGSQIDGGGGGSCVGVCTGGSDAYGNPVSASCDETVCGQDGVEYLCDGGQWEPISSEDSCCAGCSGGTDYDGNPISAHCGESVCGQGGVVYQCQNGTWQETSAPGSCSGPL